MNFVSGVVFEFVGEFFFVVDCVCFVVDIDYCEVCVIECDEFFGEDVIDGVFGDLEVKFEVIFVWF